jgi:hypothetical protein
VAVRLAPSLTSISDVERRVVAKRLAHHGPGGLPPGHLAESGAVVDGLRAEEHVIRVTALVLVHRIRLDEASAARTRVVHGGLEHAL